MGGVFAIYLCFTGELTLGLKIFVIALNLGHSFFNTNV